MRHLDLFSGIGGFALAAKWAGFETVGFCEQDEFCKSVLAARWPGVPIHNDVRDLDGRLFRGVELISGGYPCQPFSVAGERRGTEDDRHLWPEMRRIIGDARPTWVIAENVLGHVSMGLDEVLHDLEAEGYAARALVIPACAADARTKGTASGFWPTPQARDHMPAHKPEYIAAKKAQGHGMANLNDVLGWVPNPTWLEWLMGYPPGWTAPE